MPWENLDRLVQIIIGIAIGGGAAASLAALYGYYFILPAIFTGPTVCWMEAGGCAVLFRSRRASWWGVPTSLFGLLFYAILSVGLLAGWDDRVLLAGTVPALLMSIRLGSSLLRNGLECRVCWTGHAANLCICLALLTRIWA